uniref:PA domain-containing protein n=1 Tax=Loa loa TaxID=7209 RepID=A0A1I7VEX9_LOALO
MSFEEARGYYDSSYAYLFVRNRFTQKEQTFCVNYEQWRTQQIANDVKNAKVLRLGWWGGIVNNTNVCNKGKPVLLEKQAVALNYRLKIEDGRCAMPFVMKNASFKGALQYEVNQLASRNASAAIILVNKGHKYVTKWADYLKLSSDRSGQELLLQFYRPMNSRWDISMLIVWFIAGFCVTVGGYWAALRKIYEETGALHGSHQFPTGGSHVQKSRSCLNDERMTASTNCLFIIIVMFVVVGVLMLGFYFRGVMVCIFNTLLAIIGTFSIHRCLTALFGSVCKCGHCRVCVSMNDITQSIFRRDLFNYECCTERPLVVSVMIFIGAASFCISWFVFRREPYAFILLDLINIAVCIHILKGIRFPNLMVAAGTDCSKNNGGYPIAPINTEMPEKFPMLFQVPRLSDPMISCTDLEVEKEFHPVILGLGDVIVPGYLICFCFTVDFVVRTRYLYGFISIIGYGIGLIATFIALTLMETAQPALIYLIPFTLGPIIIFALIRRQFKLLWTGDFTKSREITNIVRL